MTKSNQSKLCYSYIRFSTPDQQRGHSLERQIEKSEKWAKDHGYILDRKLSFKDLGVSAYRGEQRRRGKLGDFIRLVKSDTISKGSLLLVESLDRLSREEVLEAHEHFLELIRLDIAIVTMTDGRVYSKETIKNDFTNLIISLAIMSRAHEESLTKSQRLSAVWEKKRKSAAKTPITTRSVAWVHVNKNGEKFELIPERAAIIKEIFKLAAKGWGKRMIAKHLNSRRTKPFGRGRLWHDSYIQKILTNRSVLGEFQPYRKVNGKRVPTGEPIQKYYPPVVNESLFHLARGHAKSKRPKAGRRGKVGNLFSGFVFCGTCGAPAHFVDKGKPPKGATYLACSNARLAHECSAPAWRYGLVEKAILDFCIVELDIEHLFNLSGSDTRSAIKSLTEQRLAVTDQLHHIEDRISALADSIGDQDSTEIIAIIKSRIERQCAERDSLKDDLTDLEGEIYFLTSETTLLPARLKNLEELFVLISNGTGDETLQARLDMRQELSKILDRIELYQTAPFNEAKVTRDTLNDILKSLLEEEGDLRKSFKRSKSTDKSAAILCRAWHLHRQIDDVIKWQKDLASSKPPRCLTMKFRSGRSISLFPDAPTLLPKTNLRDKSFQTLISQRIENEILQATEAILALKNYADYRAITHRLEIARRRLLGEPSLGKIAGPNYDPTALRDMTEIEDIRQVLVAMPQDTRERLGPLLLGETIP